MLETVVILTKTNKMYKYEVTKDANLKNLINFVSMASGEDIDSVFVQEKPNTPMKDISSHYLNPN